MTCHLRHHECSCAPDECKSEPKTINLDPPFIRFTNTDYAVLIAFALSIAAIVGGTMHALNNLETQYRLEARV